MAPNHTPRRHSEIDAFRSHARFDLVHDENNASFGSLSGAGNLRRFDGRRHHVCFDGPQVRPWQRRRADALTRIVVEHGSLSQLSPNPLSQPALFVGVRVAAVVPVRVKAAVIAAATRSQGWIGVRNVTRSDTRPDSFIRSGGGFRGRGLAGYGWLTVTVRSCGFVASRCNRKQQDACQKNDSRDSHDSVSIPEKRKCIVLRYLSTRLHSPMIMAVESGMRCAAVKFGTGGFALHPRSEELPSV